jgi:hypothetical protein
MSALPPERTSGLTFSMLLCATSRHASNRFPRALAGLSFHRASCSSRTEGFACGATPQQQHDDLDQIQCQPRGMSWRLGHVTPSVTFQPYGLRERHSRTLRRPRPLDHSGAITLQPYDGHLDFGCLPSDNVIVVFQNAPQYLSERAGKGAADGSVEDNRRLEPQPKCGFKCGKYFGDIGLGRGDLKSAGVSVHTHLGVNGACRHDHDRKSRRSPIAPIPKPTLRQAASADCFMGP